MKTLKAHFTAKDKNSQWDEDTTVSSKETAEGEVKQLIETFNEYRRPSEAERTFVSLNKVEEIEVPDEDDIDDFDDYEEDLDRRERKINDWEDDEYPDNMFYDDDDDEY
jgi:hypothetical protein